MNGQSRLVAGALTLAVVWIAVYWLWPTPTSPGIRFEDAGSAADADPGIVFEPPATPATAEPAPRATPAAAVPAAPEPPAPAPPASGPAPRPGVAPPQFTSHTVRAGQTMQSIAKAVYGDERRWDVIARANPRVDPLRLRAGQTLRIPVDPRNIQGLREGPEPTGAVAPTEHVVQPGETLAAIAQRVYGSSALWQGILDANRDQIRRPQDLRPGMRLLIPPRPR